MGKHRDKQKRAAQKISLTKTFASTIIKPILASGNRIIFSYGFDSGIKPHTWRLHDDMGKL